ncbi:hypothetical protein [Chengkuizengella sediminis]|uniref:hypothetical protein n=1 Tax=Chengkuizengella sediminis TaxID=1885917 RepID=UPI001389BE6B|nr:hypothetical protein [Chengkuizengella sediminis]NDI33521.1 hypothetical protein [Chengkuizengella sediminis]
MYHQQTMNQSQQSQWMQPSQQQAASNQFHLTSFRSNQQRAGANNTIQAGTQTTYQPAGFVPSAYQGSTPSTHTGNQSWQSHMAVPQSYRQTNYRSNQPSAQNTFKRQTFSQPINQATGYANQTQNQHQTYQPAGFVRSMYQSNQQQENQTTTHPSTMQRTQTTAYQPQQFSSNNPQSFHLTNYKANQRSQAWSRSDFSPSDQFMNQTQSVIPRPSH